MKDQKISSLLFTFCAKSWPLHKLLVHRLRKGLVKMLTVPLDRIRDSASVFPPYQVSCIHRFPSLYKNTAQLHAELQ